MVFDKADSSALQKLQNMACRAILRVDFRIHVLDIHDEMSLQTLCQCRCQHIGNHIYKFVKGRGPPWCVNLITWTREAHHVPTRAVTSDLLQVPFTGLRLSGPLHMELNPLEHPAIKLSWNHEKEIKTIILVLLFSPGGQAFIPLEIHRSTIPGVDIALRLRQI